MILSVDQTGRTILLKQPAKRIVSIVPSQTELLYTLGLENEVAGITKFCVHPQKWFQCKPRVGGTKQLKMDMIHSLQPDLIIANKEENVKEQVEELSRHYPVWVSDIRKLEQSFEMIQQIGLLTGKQQRANDLVIQIKEQFDQLPVFHQRLSAIYLIWKNPSMTTGADTFIHEMLERAGFSNLCSNLQRYPAITVEAIQKAAPEVLLLSSEPFPFRQKHIEELQNHLPQTKIILADGEMFSWYGSRLLHAPAYFIKLHKQIAETGQPLSG